MVEGTFTDGVVGANPLNLRLWNHDYSASRMFPGYMSVELSEEFGAVAGAGTITFPATHKLASRVMQASQDVVPITASTDDGWEWTGQIKNPVAEGKPGAETITAELICDKNHIFNVLAWPSPRTGLGLQGKFDYEVGPLRTVVTHYLAENLARVGLPCYVMLPPPRIEDKSPTIDVAAKMQPLGELLQPFLEQYEYNLTVRMWWPGKPFPEGKVIALPAGLPQIERFNRVTLGNLDNTFNPKGKPKWAPTTPGLVISVDPVRNREHVRFSTSGRGIEHFRLSGKSPGAVESIAGGKADDWVNELINLSIDSAVQGILVALGSTAGPAGAVIGAAVGNILKDQLHDIVLSYQAREDVQRKAQMGPFAPPEVFTSSSAGAFTFDTSALNERALLENAGGQTVEIVLTNGVAISLGDDHVAPNGKVKRGYKVGDRCTFEEHLSGAVVSDIITGVKVTDALGARMKVEPRVGKRRNLSNPYLDFVDFVGKIGIRLQDFGLAS